MTDITITLHNPQSGASESMPLSNTLSLQEVLEFSKALLGLDGDDWVLTKDGKPLTPLSQSLAQAGVSHGDLLLVLKRRQPQPAARPTVPAAPAGGLDFSNLLNSRPAPPVNDNPTPIYYQGMNLHEAMEANKHPKAFIQLLQTHEHLFKELNYHSPMLAAKLQNKSYEDAVQIWRDELVKGSIQGAAAVSEAYHKEKNMLQRIQANPDDKEAKLYFEQKQNRQLVNEQYRHCMNEYPESMGRVLMLYIEAKINNHPLQGFVDSGAQMTIMSKSCAERCGILHLLDTRFAGVAVGVGTGKILGKIHIAQLQIEDAFFPCSITVMDNATLPVAGDQSKQGDSDKAKPKDMDFLLGLDMLKRFNCMIDLLDGTLKFQLGDKTMSTPFLHEKDLDESKGGTKGFNADLVNQEWMAAQQKYEETKNKKEEGSDDKDENSSSMEE
ncbi:aspartyl protease [Nitzschia inconspicua]|uniref:Aspartyl protease n=1 Tax=Nitzschia inconspicua TaxID=303405 RepID=A0A9K3KDV3_9STRA|nr:aspartyl protease [Nitzschia inconspicua]